MNDPLDLCNCDDEGQSTSTRYHARDCLYVRYIRYLDSGIVRAVVSRANVVQRINRAMTYICLAVVIAAIAVWLTAQPGIDKQMYNATFPVLIAVFVAILWLERTARPTMLHSILLTIVAIPIFGAMVACVVVALRVFMDVVR
jgi:hypothetical protein